MSLDPPRHLVLFTRGALERLLRQTGFAPERPPRAAPTAWQTYTQSAAIRDGRSPEQGPARGRRAVRVRAVIADWRALVAPVGAEELVVIASAADSSSR